MPPASPDRWISTFLQAIAAEADAARNTRLAYGRDLKDFADWATSRGLDLATLGRGAGGRGKRHHPLLPALALDQRHLRVAPHRGQRQGA